MIAGISTACFYPQHTETALSDLCNIGIESTEIFINSVSELAPGFICGLKKTADDSNVKILSVHPCTSLFETSYFFSEYDRRFDDGMEVYKKFYEAANNLGAKIVVFHGAIQNHSFQLSTDAYCERFGILVEDAKQYGIHLCHENVAYCVGKTPAFFTEILSRLPDARFVLDVKQAKRAGASPFDFAEAMDKNLAHIHISDHDDDNSCLLPGAGSFNITNFLSTVSKNGFDGGVIVELYRQNFSDIVEINAGYQHVSSCISTVKQN